MSEIEVVVDVRQSPDTAELIVSKQRIAFNGAAHLVGSPVESRVSLVAGNHERQEFDSPGLVFHRRAMPLFDTLPEAERVAVIRAVNPLRGLEDSLWSATGAEPLENGHLAFFVRASDDLGVLVTPTEDRGVEIADIVRESALDQFGDAGQDKKQ